MRVSERMKVCSVYDVAMLLGCCFICSFELIWLCNLTLLSLSICCVSGFSNFKFVQYRGRMRDSNSIMQGELRS